MLHQSTLPSETNGFKKMINVKSLWGEDDKSHASSIVEACLPSANVTEWAGTSRGKAEKTAVLRTNNFLLPWSADLAFLLHSRFVSPNDGAALCLENYTQKLEAER